MVCPQADDRLLDRWRLATIPELPELHSACLVVAAPSPALEQGLLDAELAFVPCQYLGGKNIDLKFHLRRCL